MNVSIECSKCCEVDLSALGSLELGPTRSGLSGVHIPHGYRGVVDARFTCLRFYCNQCFDEAVASGEIKQ